MESHGQPAIGVDWAGGHWIAVVFTDHSYADVTVEESFEAIYETYDDAATICVDIPIGLVSADSASIEGELARKCDSLARQAVGGRYRSVFTPPCREAARAAAVEKSYERVADLNDSITGKGLSSQAYAIASAIGEVDSFLGANTDAQDVVIESHPEVCFRAFADAPLQHSKHTAPGYGERLDALDAVLDDAAGCLQTVARDLHGTTADIGVDDVVDAIALAVTAHDPAYTLPAEPPTDAVGLPMQIAYRSESAFTLE